MHSFSSLHNNPKAFYLFKKGVFFAVLLLCSLLAEGYLLWRAHWTTPKHILLDKFKKTCQGSFASDLGTVGLENHGNRCFANSTIQALFNCTQFREMILDDSDPNSLRHSSYKNLKSLFEKMSSPFLDCNACSPELLYKSFPRDSGLHQLFRGYRQQDSAEFFASLCDHLASLQDFQLGKRLVDLFEIQKETTLRCQQCKRVSTTVEAMPVLKVNIPEHYRGSTLDLHVLLQNMFYTESVHYTCTQNGCQSQASTMSIALLNSPEYLVIQVVRFGSVVRQVGDKLVAQSYKISNDLNAMPEISIRRYVKDSADEARYRLRSIVRHYGVLEGGHYTCDVFNGRHFVSCNDLYVAKIVQSSFEDTSSGYVLIYEKAKADALR